MPQANSQVQLQVLISTCNDRVYNVKNVLSEPVAEVSYIIVHQVFDENALNQYHAFLTQLQYERADVTVISSASRGLANSRNIALKRASAPYLLFADDDICFLPGALASVIATFNTEQDAAVLTFRYCMADMSHRKVYPEARQRRSLFSLFRVSSIEVAVRREFIQQHGVQFDNQFGLGAKFPVSEENIFLVDIYRSGGAVVFIPLDIAVHPDETSGMTWDVANVSAKGALFRRVFGLKGAILLIVFLVRHMRKFDSIGDFVSKSWQSMLTFFNFKR